MHGLDTAAGVNEELLRVLNHEATACAGIGLADGGDHRLQRQVVGGQALGVHLHLILPGQSTDRDDLRDARHRQQPPTQQPIRRGFQRHLVMLIRYQRDEHDFAHDGRDRCQRGRGDVRRQLAAGGLQLLCHDLARAIDVGLPVELNDDDGQPDAGVRAHTPHAGRSIHGGFDREGHEPLDLLGRQAMHFGDDRDGRRCQVGEDIDRCPQRLPRAPGQQDQGCSQHQSTVGQRSTDQRFNHQST